jgi:hypothetical protein
VPLARARDAQGSGDILGFRACHAPAAWFTGMRARMYALYRDERVSTHIRE